MKWWHTGLLTAALCASLASLALASDVAPVPAAESADKTVTEAVETKTPVPVIDPAVNMKDMSDYYLTSGKEYEKVISLLESLPKDKTGLPSGNYYYRIDKALTGGYFYHAAAYDNDNHVRIGSFFVAKDKSNVWKLSDTEEAALIFGTTETLMDKVELTVYPSKLTIGSYGIVRVRVPGMVPYDIKLTSLSDHVAKINEDLSIKPLREGETDLVADVRIGDTMKTFTKKVKVIDTADKGGHGYHSGPSIGIGVGVGSWHHHGGIGIGIGPWW